MEDFALTAAKEIPALAVLCLVVWKFLKFLEQERATRQALEEARGAALQHLGDNCHGFQMDMMTRHERLAGTVVASLDRNTEAFGRVEKTLEDVDQHIRQARTANTQQRQ